MSDARMLGEELTGWTPPPRPAFDALDGQWTRLERLSADTHAASLFRAYSGHDALWDYMPNGPFSSATQYHRWAREAEASADPLHFAIQNRETGRWGGTCALLRIAPEAGSVELGYIALAPELQRTRTSTEAFLLLIEWAFEAGYRRFEWKCNALNMPSRRAAQRLGLSYEGTFRQAQVVKGRNRDTAWFAAIDSEWPALREAYRAWLRPENFDAEGRQKERLGDLTSLVRAASDPAL
ncbi:GNAT family N-acetyltransferase [Vannielia litorea]|uniref:GNAT family N-acetyltransferase n=1 Tax=Vannielia litorea TaxID=1217970 RepID=UPI001C9616DD|nr:GNAT family protein [Vannielia litorea]MBY6048408.1 GNAT family N-acetyltransferase [Vannielia litorea]MBY6075822.1 GNAT family N-acetyltransferase [Vannielia litorea]